MSRRLRAVCLALAVLAVLTAGAGAEDRRELDPALTALDPESAALVDPEAGDWGFAAGARELLARAWEEARDELLSGARSVAVLLAGTVLLGAAESLAAGSGAERWVPAVGALWVTSAAAGDVSALIGLGGETVAAMDLVGRTLLPVLAAASAAGGAVTAAAARQVATVAFSQLLLGLMEKLLLPMVYLYVGVVTAEAVLEEELLDALARGIKKVIGWGLTGLTAAFTLYLSVAGGAAAAADAAAVRAARSAVSALVPVVGGILSDAAGSLVAGASLIRGMTGVFGLLAALSVCLVPVLRLGGQYLLYQGAALAASAAGSRGPAKLVGRLGEAFALVLAMAAASAAALMISIVSSLTAVTV